MAQYVSFDPMLPSPQPILGWYDTDRIPYPNLPPVASEIPAGFVAVTAPQWTQHLADLAKANWSIVSGSLAYTAPAAPPGPSLAAQAQAALDVMDGPGGCAIRCFKAGVAFPDAWQTYCVTLRAIVNGTASPMPTTLPVQPAFPAGT